MNMWWWWHHIQITHTASRLNFSQSHFFSYVLYIKHVALIAVIYHRKLRAKQMLRRFTKFLRNLTKYFSLAPHLIERHKFTFFCVTWLIEVKLNLHLWIILGDNGGVNCRIGVYSKSIILGVVFFCWENFVHSIRENVGDFPNRIFFYRFPSWFIRCPFTYISPLEFFCGAVERLTSTYSHPLYFNTFPSSISFVNLPPLT